MVRFSFPSFKGWGLFVNSCYIWFWTQECLCTYAAHFWSSNNNNNNNKTCFKTKLIPVSLLLI